MRIKSNKKYKYIENRKLMGVLRYGDRIKIAEIAGCSVGKVREIIQGKRQMTDDVAMAITQHLEQRKEIHKALYEAIN